MKQIFLSAMLFLFTLPVFAQETEEAAPATPAAEKPTDPDNPGMSWLDQAVEEKLKSSGIADFGKVISLAQRARKEGLSGETLKFCDELIASERLQRGLIMAQQLIDRPPGQLPQGWNVARIKILADLEEAVKTIKDQPIPYLRIAQLNLLPEGDMKRAAESLDQAARLSKDNAPLLAEATRLKALLEPDPVKREEMIAQALKANDDPQLLLVHAKSLADLKRFDEAMDAVKMVLKEEPDNLEALLVAFELLSNQGKFDEALKILDVLEEKTPGDQLKLQRARLLSNMGRNDEAIGLLDDLREKHPNDVTILAIRAAVYLDTKEFEKALKDIDAALRIAPNKTPFLLLKAQCLLAMERFEDATALIEELRKDNPESVELTLLLVQVLATQKKSKKALELLNPLLEKSPDNLALLRLKGQMLLSINRHGEAVKTLEAVVKADPKDEVSLNNLSWLLSTSPIDMIRNGTKALELAKKACELTDYKKAYILSTLAAAYAELGDFDKAIEWSQKSIELSKDDDNVKDRVDELQKELDSYEKKQPFREAMNEDAP